jgi:hypothetical protein
MTELRGREHSGAAVEEPLHDIAAEASDEPLQDILEGASEFFRLRDHLTWPEDRRPSAERDAAALAEAWDEVGQLLVESTLEATRGYESLNRAVSDWSKARRTNEQTIQAAIEVFRQAWDNVPAYRRWLETATTALDAAMTTATSFKAIEAAIADMARSPNVAHFTDDYKTTLASLLVINDVFELVKHEPSVIAAISATIEAGGDKDDGKKAPGEAEADRT